MKKRCFPRFDAQIDARYCPDDAPGDWRSCRITKISRKGIGVVFAAAAPPAPGSLLQFKLKLSTAGEAGYANLQGVLKWIKRMNNCCDGGIELNEIVDETLWLQMIYFIREPHAEKKIVDLKTMPAQITVKKAVHPPPAKVIISTKLDYLKSILNYKIL
jgi:hypothetical protein